MFLKTANGKSSAPIPYRESETGIEISDTETKAAKNTRESVSERVGDPCRHTRLTYVIMSD